MGMIQTIKVRSWPGTLGSPIHANCIVLELDKCGSPWQVWDGVINALTTGMLVLTKHGTRNHTMVEIWISSHIRPVNLFDLFQVIDPERVQLDTIQLLPPEIVGWWGNCNKSSSIEMYESLMSLGLGDWANPRQSVK